MAIPRHHLDHRQLQYSNISYNNNYYTGPHVTARTFSRPSWRTLKSATLKGRRSMEAYAPLPP